MKYRWRHLVNVGEELTGQPTPAFSYEAKLRSAISRAYYGAGMEGREFLQVKEGITFPSTTNLHSAIISYFRKSRKKGYKRIGDELDQLRRYRNMADYDNNFPSLAKASKDALRLARSIIRRLDSL